MFYTLIKHRFLTNRNARRVLSIFYNIASRATQSNSVYVSVLQIPIVHSRADGVSKSLSEIFFFSHEQPLLARGKILYFGTIKDTNRDSAHQFQNEDNFPTFSIGLEVLRSFPSIALRIPTAHNFTRD